MESLPPFNPDHSYIIIHTLRTSAQVVHLKNWWGKKERAYLGETKEWKDRNTSWDKLLKVVWLWAGAEQELGAIIRSVEIQPDKGY